MTLPASRARTPFIVNTALAAVLGAAALAGAQQPAGTATAPAAAAPAKKPNATEGAKTAPAARSTSYSLGVSMGDQLHASGVPADSISAAGLAQGVHDALTGKTKLTDADRDNIKNLITAAASTQGDANHRAAAKYLAENAKKPDVVTTASGLQYRVINAGSGAPPKPTDEVTVNYTGKLIDGTEFDSSYKRGQPATFQLNHVIPGWSEGVGLMKPGAKYELFVPPNLAYDLRSPPPIPPGSLLIFEVELMSAKAAPAAATPPAAPPPAAAPPAPKPQK